MTREVSKRLGLFQIVRYNVSAEDFKDDAEHEWLIPYCGKLAVVTQKIIWNDDRGGEEIHLRFPRKGFGLDSVFYSSIEELQEDFANGRDISFNEGFDTGAAEIDKVDSDEEKLKDVKFFFEIDDERTEMFSEEQWDVVNEFLDMALECGFRKAKE